MKAMTLITIGVVTLAAAAVVAQNPPAPGGGPGAPPMTLTTSGWADGTDIPVKFTQAGDQLSPELKWTNAPAGTQSFARRAHRRERLNVEIAKSSP